MLTREEIAHAIDHFEPPFIAELANERETWIADNMRHEIVLMVRKLALSPPEPTERQITDAMVEEGAKVMASLCTAGIIEMPQLPAPCWNGSIRAILEAALRATPPQGRVSEVLCACADNCAKDKENARLREALKIAREQVDANAHGRTAALMAIDGALRGGDAFAPMVAEEQTEAK